MYNKVIWSEGMFLHPQHFQQQDRYHEFISRNHLTLLHPHPWGFDELEIDPEMLALGRISIKKCRALLPDGTLIDIPNVDSSPSPLQIPEGSQNSTIYLGVPLRQFPLPEVSENEDNSSLTRYKAFSSSLTDNTASDINNSATIQLGKICLRIIGHEEECQGYSTLAIAKVKEVATGGLITLDETFIPSFLNAKNHSKLKSYIEECVGLLHYRGETLSQRVINPGEGEMAEMADFMLLQIINQYEPILSHFLKDTWLSPQKLFENLLSLLGNLVTFTQKNRRLPQNYYYNHGDLLQTFEPLMSDLRKALAIVLNQSARAITLTQHDTNLWIADIIDKAILESSDFVLAVNAQVPNEEIRDNFPTCIKICPVEEVEEFIAYALPGITIEALSVAPRKIPFHVGYTYFRLNKYEDDLWQKFQKTSTMALHVSGIYPELKLELWAIFDNNLKL